MTNLPVRRPAAPLGRELRSEMVAESEGDRREELWQVFRRNRWLIAGCVLLAITAAGWFAWRKAPLYTAAASLRMENKSADLPGIFRSITRGGEVLTEIEMLRSRTLAEDATAGLGLQLSISKPRSVHRDSIFSVIETNRAAHSAEYRMRRQRDGKLQIRNVLTDALVAVATPGTRVDLGNIAFTLAPTAAEFPDVVFSVLPFPSAVAGVAAGVGVAQAARDAGVVLVSYTHSDPKVAAGVPNIITSQYLSRRQDAQKAEARSAVRFLRGQLDTLSAQLKEAEDELRRFREQERVVNPTVEATGQVTRLIQLQSERATLEAERSALASVLSTQPTTGTDSATSYRRLLAFPSLLRDRAATELLASLTATEQERSELLTRRTENDPDVQALTARIGHIENQLRQFAATYLQGLTGQISSLDAGLGQFSQQLGGVPRRELDFARLERKPKILEEVYTMLQTRMKEAEISAAVDDPSVRMVDVAVPPIEPAGLPRAVFLVGGAFAGLLMGVSAAFAREYRDRSVRTRKDVRVATGLPVMGLIPRLPKTGKKSSIIAERTKRPDSATNGHAAATEDRKVRSRFTFLQDVKSVDPAQPVSSSLVSNSLKELWVALPPPGTLTSEAYGILQTNVAFSRSDVQVKTVVLTSALPGEGKTTTAVNFALTVTQRGIRVLLVDADVRKGVVHTMLGTPQSPGLSEVLAGTVILEQACRPVVVGGRFTLHVLPTGRLPASPLGMLESPQMHDFLARVREEYDLVILDAPPVNLLTDAAILGTHADAVLLVARSGITDTAALTYAAEQLQHVGAPVVGVVLNDIDFKKDMMYDAAYRYYTYDSYSSASTT